MLAPFVKVCCIQSLKEAELARKLGADLLGFVSKMPSGPGVITLENISQIVGQLAPGSKSVLLTSKVNAHDIYRQHLQVGTWGVQLVDRLPTRELILLKKMLPVTQLIQVIHVQDKTAIDEALGYSDLVQFILLDSGNPSGALKNLGGTGTTHDWEISREICVRSTLPVLLAGGLNSGNIQQAVDRVSPAGVDLCSGVRTAGNLDPLKLQKLMGNLTCGKL
ncbi:MAG: phosphoribosylanthranilate isomerase [Candidatus Marinimicrobia bacterium]|nr:phosphoribosylanthranilate isomerase [Candidatus Neomarinimicrobiota bacterium]